ncbi:hypothetical protein [Kitasatospora griseola]|uniref:hypothetical protein n=1 Tax=Kitasatospora griseola TaxID=2064 RepID=UPI003429DF9F
MRDRARFSTDACRVHYEAATFRRKVARRIGPRQVGGLYRVGNSETVYEVLRVDR